MNKISTFCLQVGVLRVLHGREAGDAPERAVHVPAPRGHHDRGGPPALHARQGARSVNELIGSTRESRIIWYADIQTLKTQVGTDNREARYLALGGRDTEGRTRTDCGGWF